LRPRSATWTGPRNPLILLERDEYGERQAVEVRATIALACCKACKRRTRVLPCDVVSRKVYSLALIEHQLARYAAGEHSLRQVSWDLLGERTPAHTSLFGWSEGLGAHVLGRARTDAELGLPASRLLSESEARCPSIGPVLRHEAPVDPRRYKSEARRERLSAMATLLLVAVLVTGRPSPESMSEWRRLAFTWTRSSAPVFSSAIPCTRIERMDPKPRPGSSPRSRASRAPCPPPARSPPGASSRSPPS
jgi:hypothetical protein